jgi:hypothetical protein
MRHWSALLFVLLGVGLALGDLSSAASDLSGALTARAAALGTPPKGSPELLELKQLTKADKALAKFRGTLDPKGLLALVKTGKALAKSNTADPATVSAAAALVASVLDALAVQEAQLLADATGMLAPADHEQLQGHLDRARAEVGTAALDTTPPDQAFAAVKRALRLYGTAARFVQKVLGKQESQISPIVSYPFVVQNRNGVPYTIQSLSFDLVFTPDSGDPVRVQADFLSHQDPASGFVLPYRMRDSEAEFEIYPTLYRAVESVAGPNPAGTVLGVVRFKSTKHGKALVPVDEFLFAP